MDLPETEKQFEQIIKEVTEDLFNAKYQSRLYWKINSLVDNYKLNQSRAFWTIILKALQESAVLSLARAYDKHPKSVHLMTLIDFIISNTHIFEVEYFKNRLKENPYRDNLAKRTIIPTQENLRADRNLVSNKDPLVNKLIAMRGNVIAHKNISIAIEGKNIPNILTWGDFDDLVKRGFEIRNKYSDMYDASTYAEDFLIGKNDYQYVFRKLGVGDLAYDFVNLKFPYMNPENHEEMINEFVRKAKNEMYRKDP
jgi:hypothetical protein